MKTLRKKSFFKIQTAKKIMKKKKKVGKIPPWGGIPLGNGKFPYKKKK